MRPTRLGPRPLLAGLVLVAAGCGRGGPTALGAKEGPPPGFARYVSSPAGLTGRMASDYHPFRFDYPAGCEVVPHGPDNPRNYVTVRRQTGSGDGRETVEELNVGHVWVDTPGETVRSKLTELAADLRDAFGGPGTAVTSEGRRDVGGVGAYEVRLRQQSAGGGGRRLVRPQQVIPRPGRAPLIIPAVYADTGPATPGQVYTVRALILPAPGDRPSGLLVVAVSRGDGDGPLAAAVDSFRFGAP
ncbi:MAG: hypothetical protein C0501_22260 [Isosphaera sp.]|nr:hypothetical protein [Isosphaera sp.]